MERGGSTDWPAILSTVEVSSKPSSLSAREQISRPEASRWPPEAPRQEAGHRNRPPPRRRSLGAFPARDSFRVERGGWENAAAPHATSNAPPLNGGAAAGERGRIREEAATAAQAVIFSVSVPAWDLRRTLKIEAKAEHFQRVVEKIHALVHDVKSWDKSAEVLKDLSREEALELGEEYRERMRQVERRLEALELGEKQRALVERRRSLEEAQGETVLARLRRQKEPEDRSAADVLERIELDHRARRSITSEGVDQKANMRPDDVHRGGSLTDQEENSTRPTSTMSFPNPPSRRGSRGAGPPSAEEAERGSLTRSSASRPGSKQGPPSEGRRGSKKSLQEEGRFSEGTTTAGSLERLPPALSSHESRRGSRQDQEQRAATAAGSSRSRHSSKERAVSEVVGPLPTTANAGTSFSSAAAGGSFEQGKTTDPEKLALATAVARLEGELARLKAEHEKEKSQLEAGLKAAEQRRVQAELRAKVILVQEKAKVSIAAQTDFDDEKRVDVAQLTAFVEAFEEAALAYRGETAEEDRRQQREAFVEQLAPKHPSDRSSRQRREDGGATSVGQKSRPQADDDGATATTAVGAETALSRSPAGGSRTASKTRAAADHSEQQSAGLLEILGNTSLKI